MQVINYVEPNTTYWLGIKLSEILNVISIVKYNNNGAFIERITTNEYKGDGINYTTDDNTYYIKLNFSTSYGTVYNNDIIIAKGTAKVQYEPYTGGQPSPSPEYPQEIKTLTGNIKLTSCGKNLLDYINNVKSSINGLTSVINADGSITTTGKPTSDYSTITKQIDITDILEDGNAYTISQSVPANLFIQINAKKIDNTQIYINSNTGSSSFVVDKSIYTKYILIIQTSSMAKWGDSSLTITNKYMLCKGTDTADTSFEPYQDSSLNITIPENEFVGKINDTYKDTLNVVYKDDGHYHIILNKMIGKTILDGSENWNYDSNSKYFRDNTYVFEQIPLSMTSENKAMYSQLSNSFIVNKNWSGTNSFRDNLNIQGEFYPVQNAGYKLAFRNLNFDNVDDFKSYLSSKNIIVVYPLETPYEVDLGIADTLLTFDEITNIFTDSNLLPIINVKYYRNFITTIQNLQVNDKALKQELVDINNRLTALETAQANLINDIPTEESEVTE